MRGILTALAFLVAAGCERSEGLHRYMRLEGPAPAPFSTQSTPLLVAFWATWCPPCREEAAELRALGRDPPEGLSLITISQDLELRTVGDFFGGSIPPELNLRLDAEHRLANQLAVSQLPAGILIVNGKLVARFDGAQQWSSRPMRRLLSRLTAGAPSP